MRSDSCRGACRETWNASRHSSKTAAWRPAPSARRSRIPQYRADSLGESPRGKYSRHLLSPWELRIRGRVFVQEDLVTTQSAAPRAERPTVPEGYGCPADDEGMLTWAWAEDQLTRAANFCFATSRPNGRPHSSPTWAVWLDGKLYFDGSPETRRMKNIAANPHVSVHLESGNEVVILEGTASSVAAPPDRA